MTEEKKSLRFIQFLPGIAWFLFVLVLICLPGDDVPEEPEWLSIPDLDKFIHAALFGGNVFWFCMPFKKAAMETSDKVSLFLRMGIAGIVWGLATEFIQLFFIPGRQFDLMDWAADSAGAIIAFFVARKFFV